MMITRNLSRHLFLRVVPIAIMTQFTPIAVTTSSMFAAGHDQEKSLCRIRLSPAHPWRPPFGLERVGRPQDAIVELAPNAQPLPKYVLVGYQHGNEIARSILTLTGKPPYICPVGMDPRSTELVLFAKSAEGTTTELTRTSVTSVPFEADAIARPDRLIHPVDLGTILPPSDWLLLASGQKGTIDVAAICRSGDVPGARVSAWFESVPAVKTAVAIALVKDRRVQLGVPLPPTPVTLDRDI